MASILLSPSTNFLLFFICVLYRYADLVRSGRLRFLHASAVNTTLPDESVDFIVSQFVFQHLYHPRAAVAEAHRVLRIGGIAVPVPHTTIHPPLCIRL